MDGLMHWLGWISVVVIILALLLTAIEIVSRRD